MMHAILTLGTLLLGITALSVIVAHSGGASQVIDSSAKGGATLIQAATLQGSSMFGTSGNIGVGSSLSNLTGLGG